MTIELQPEVEALLRQRMERGGFKNVEDLLAAMLRSASETEEHATVTHPRSNFAEFLMESPLPDSGLVLERLNDFPRPVEL